VNTPHFRHLISGKDRIPNSSIVRATVSSDLVSTMRFMKHLTKHSVSNVSTNMQPSVIFHVPLQPLLLWDDGCLPEMSTDQDWIRTEVNFGKITTGSDCNIFENWQIRTGSDWENLLFWCDYSIHIKHVSCNVILQIG